MRKKRRLYRSVIEGVPTAVAEHWDHPTFCLEVGGGEEGGGDSDVGEPARCWVEGAFQGYGSGRGGKFGEI